MKIKTKNHSVGRNEKMSVILGCVSTGLLLLAALLDPTELSQWSALLFSALSLWWCWQWYQRGKAMAVVVLAMAEKHGAKDSVFVMEKKK